MCFSAAASFTAGGVLSATGTYTLSKAKNKKELPLATVPLFFGIQQIIEGAIWMTAFSGNWHQILTYTFLAFALVPWPTFVPITIFLIEKNKLRKKLISYLIILGTLVSAYLIIILIRNSISSELLNNSIKYRIHEPHHIIGTIIYVIVACGSALLSSKKIIQILGTLTTVGLLISLYFYTSIFTSVWCFFAAVISLVIIFYFTRPLKN